MRLFSLASLALACLLSIAAPLTAAPVAEAERIPLDVRRTTLVVRDMEEALRFYRDAIGLRVVYDNKIRTPRSASSDAEAERALRLVFLQANDDYIGIIGMIEYTKPRKPEPESQIEPFGIGSTIFVVNAENLDETFARASQVPGVTVLSEPSETNYPSYDGSGTIPVRVSVLRDMNGYIVELNQLLVDSPR
jgi:catechol 2,3-dioxygenase-like lactoylglutathione lyase family enzyme